MHKVGDWLFAMDDEPIDVGLLSTDAGTFVGFMYTDTNKVTHRVAFPADLAATVGKGLVLTAVEAAKVKGPKQPLVNAPDKEWVN